MVLREVKTFVGPKGFRIEEYIPVNGATGVSLVVEAENLAKEKYIKASAESTSPVSMEDFKPDLSKIPQTVYIGIQKVPGAVVDDKGNIVGITPQDILFPIVAKNRIEAIEGFEKGFEAFMKNIEEKERKRQQSLVIPDEQTTQAINEDAKNFKLVTEK